jgi:large subunit ribosomal protein L17
VAFIELLGAEKELTAKAEKRAEARSKRREELQKQLEEQNAAEGGESNS